MGMYYACICFLGDGHGCTYDDRFIHSKKKKKRKSYLDLLFHISTKTVIILVQCAKERVIWSDSDKKPFIALYLCHD